MSPIEFTKDHELKLLEMCNSLFTEYKSIKIYEIDTDVPEDNNIEIINFWNGIDYGKSIHWFEFCHEHLSPKILGDTNLIFCGPNRPHPIDFLYEQFKQLK